MMQEQAIQALAALANEHRMSIYRTVLAAGPSGLPAGQIAERSGLGASNVSFHVAQMERAGLLRSWRVQRNVFYAVEMEGMRQLLAFLTEDCCGGHPEVCGVVARRVT
jgi:DNA-binding transcriptional ArsR family regulator